MEKIRRTLSLLALAGSWLALSAGIFHKGKPNLVLITLDTLRADHLPAYGYKKLETPAMDGLVKDGVLFKKALAHAPITAPSHASILSGLYPPAHGIRNNGDFYAPKGLTLAAQILKENGYQTAAFVSSFLLNNRFGFSRGFDVYDDDMSDAGIKTLPFEFKERRGEKTLERARAWLEARFGPKSQKKGPFFLWVHFYDPHQSYDPPEPFKTIFKERPYDGEIAYVDQQVGILLDDLKKKGLYDDSLIVLTGDHGENLGEHGESAHAIFIYNATQRIPLVIKLPGGRKSVREVGNLVRHVDFLPTIVEALGPLRVSKPVSSAFQGKSLLGLMRGEKESAERESFAESYLPKDYYGWAMLESLQNERRKFIEAPKPELYDLEKDPGELQNLAPQDRKTSEELKSRLDVLKGSWGVQAPKDEAFRRLDPEVAEGLKALGYLVSSEPEKADLGKDPKDMIRSQETIQSAHQSVIKKDFQKALDTVLPLLKNNPENLTARTIAAGAYKELGRIDDAIRELQEIRRRDPKSLASFVGLSRIYTKERPNFKEAERELSAAFLLAPQDPGLWVLKGDLHQQKEEFDKSIEAYEKAAAMKEQAGALFVGWGSALNKQGKYAEAREKLLVGIRLEPENVEAHYNLGVVHEREGKNAEAEAEYRLALKQNPKDYLSLGNLGSLYQRLGRLREAIDVLQQALQVKADDMVALYNLGSVYLEQDKPKEAIPLLEKAAKLNPKLAVARNNLALAYTRAKRPEKAFEQYRRISEMSEAEGPLRSMALYRMAQIRAGQNKRKESEKYLRSALERGGERLRQAAANDPLFKSWAISAH